MPKVKTQPIRSDRSLDALKARERPYEVSIAERRGLVVRIFPTGAKQFEFRYVTPAGVRRRHKLGLYPALTMADAKDKALRIQVQVGDGKDPAAERSALRTAARTGDTLSDLAQAYFLACEKGLHGGRGRPKRPSTIRVEQNRFKKRIAPKLGDKKFALITRAEVKSFMRELASPEVTSEELAADSIASIGRTLSSILAFAVHEERLAVNPAAGLTRPLALRPRERMFSEEALRMIWSALSRQAPRRGSERPEDAHPVDPIVSHALRLLLVTMTRRGDIAGARWEEFDLGAKVWTVPATRHKSRRVHVVPLTETALSLLRGVAVLSHGRDVKLTALKGFVFPSRLRDDAHITEAALTKALSRLTTDLEIPHGSPHDFRRTAATLLTSERAGVRRFIISKVLGHTAQEGAAVTEVYDRHDYISEKRRSLEQWEGILLTLSNGLSTASNVTQFPDGLQRA